MIQSKYNKYNIEYFYKTLKWNKCITKDFISQPEYRSIKYFHNTVKKKMIKI